MGKQADRNAAKPMYRVWRPLHDETEETGGQRGKPAEYGAIDERSAALYHANVCHAHRDGWEWSWPVTFRVKNMATGKVWDIEVERHSVPEFVANTPKEV